jgi:hypothetical protein
MHRVLKCKHTADLYQFVHRAAQALTAPRDQMNQQPPNSCTWRSANAAMDTAPRLPKRKKKPQNVQPSGANAPRMNAPRDWASKEKAHLNSQRPGAAQCCQIMPRLAQTQHFNPKFSTWRSASAAQDECTA